MCLAVPMKIVEIRGKEAVVAYKNLKTKARLDLIDNCKVGDYVLIHAGFVIQKLDEKSAEESLQAWEELIAALEKEKAQK